MTGIGYRDGTTVIIHMYKKTNIDDKKFGGKEI